MAQRLTQLRRVFYGDESSTEGTDPTNPTLGTATEALLVEDLSFSPQIDYHVRKFFGTNSKKTGKLGARHADLSFTMELRNRGATNNVADIDKLLEVLCGSRTPSSGADSGSTTVASATDADTFELTSGSNFADRQGMLVSTASGGAIYEAALIDDITSTTVNLEKGLSFTPASGANAKSMVTYALSETGHKSLAFQIWLDSTVYLSFVGCKCTATIMVPEAGAIPKIKFDFKAIAWDIIGSGTRPEVTVGDSGAPPVAMGSRFKRDTSLTSIRSFEFTVGNEIAKKTSHNATYGGYSLVVGGQNPSGKIRYYNEDQTHWDDWEAGTERWISHQFSTSLNNVVAIFIPAAQLKTAALGDENGLTTDELEFDANEKYGRISTTSKLADAYIAFG